MSKKNEAKELKVGYMPIAECLPLFIAVDQGYFKDLGLNVKLLSFSGGAHILESLGAGSVDIGFSNLVSLFYSRQGKKDFVAVWGSTKEDYSNILHGIIILDSIKIKSPQYLVNKKIAINTFRNIDDLLLSNWLKKYNINRNQISLLEVPFPRMPSVLKNGDVDAVAVVEPFLTIIKSKFNGKNLGDYFLADNNEITITSYCSSKKWINKNKEKLSKFKLAMNKAVDFFNLNKDKSRLILTKYTKLSNELAKKISLPIFTKKLPDESHLQFLLNEMKKNGWIESDINIKELLYE